MKRAISYIRISTKDQSNFSLSGQEQYIKEYCARKDIEIVNTFIDNGQSAKNFDRADWHKLEDFVKHNYKSIDYLVVVKYDRFSRNVSDGLNMMDKLERKFSISVLSVFEEISISPESPFFFKMRTDMLVQAEFELRVIKDRTKFGIKQAIREGRWINRAPFGYKNIRDANNKPGIEVDPKKAEVIKEIFRMFLDGVPQKEIYRQAHKLGYKVKGNSAVKKVLTNPVYVGMISLNDELFKGNHEPIIDHDTFTRVQYSLNPPQPKTILSDEVPLRATLKCFCGRPLTAGRSKGKNGYHWYYKCPDHLNINLNAKKLHDKIIQLMEELSLSHEDVKEIQEKTKENLYKILKQRKESLPEIMKKIDALNSNLESLEEKFIKGQLNFETYSKWRVNYGEEIKTLEDQTLLKTESIWETYQDQAYKLTGLADFYKMAPTTEKQNIINAVFNSSLKYQLNTFLSSYLLDIFLHKELILKEKGLLKIEAPSLKFVKNSFRTPKGSIVELFEILKRLTG